MSCRIVTMRASVFSLVFVLTIVSQSVAATTLTRLTTKSDYLARSSSNTETLYNGLTAQGTSATVANPYVKGGISFGSTYTVTAYNWSGVWRNFGDTAYGYEVLFSYGTVTITLPAGKTAVMLELFGRTAADISGRIEASDGVGQNFTVAVGTNAPRRACYVGYLLTGSAATISRIILYPDSSTVTMPGVRSVMVGTQITPPTPTFSGLIWNEDCTERFFMDAAGAMTLQTIERLLDPLRNTQVRRVFDNVNAQRTNYVTTATNWEWMSDGFDPNGGQDQQPYMGDLPQVRHAGAYQLAQNLYTVTQAGIDTNTYMMRRGKLVWGLSMWASIRMNDGHDGEYVTAPGHSTFWKNNSSMWRYTTFNSVCDRCLDYNQASVRNNMMNLVNDVLTKYSGVSPTYPDIDGLELDFVRHPAYCQTDSTSVANAKTNINSMMSQIRTAANAKAAERGHPIKIAVRVPSDPTVANGIGLDYQNWASNNYIDVLIPSNFYAAGTDFDVPVETWVSNINNPNVSVIVALEGNSRFKLNPSLAAPTSDVNTPELMMGSAMAALYRGSQGIYLFNYMGTQLGGNAYLLNVMGDMGAMEQRSRAYRVSYRDCTVPPGATPTGPLPRSLFWTQSANFSIYIGPAPLPSGEGVVTVTKSGGTLALKLNGYSPDAGTNVWRYDRFQPGYNTINVKNTGFLTTMTVQDVMLSLNFPTP